MEYEIYRYIFIGAAILTVVMFTASVSVFVLMKIPRVIGDLTGSTAKKAIQNIRDKNINTGAKTYKSSVVNKERGKITDKISQSGKIVQKQINSTSAMMTEKIDSQELYNNETTLLTEQFPQLTDIFEIEFEITYIHTNEVIV